MQENQKKEMLEKNENQMHSVEKNKTNKIFYDSSVNLLILIIIKVVICKMEHS